MKRSPRPRKTPASLSESTHSRLNMYALAASAAGVGLLAIAQPAEAKIVYTPAHRLIGPNSRYALDLNHDGITDFTFINSGGCGTDTCGWVLALKPARSNRAVGYIFRDLFLVDSALNRGVRIGPGDGFQKGWGEMVEVTYFSSTNLSGPWANTKSRYLGLKLKIKGETHYGWARLNVKVQKTVITGTLTGYAYETTPNKPIFTGKTRGPDDDSSAEQADSTVFNFLTPATLGLLALGSPGLSIWRREELLREPNSVGGR